jgi:leader peptidase (prepilin peptidase)/N-methyltransferase
VSALLVIFSAVFGAATAAFLPRVAHRLAVGFGEPARSACAACGTGFDGWVRVGAACRCTSWPVVIVPVGAGVSVLLALAVGATPLLPGYLLTAVAGLLLAVIDLSCLRLPDRLVGALAVIGAVPPAVLHPERIGVALMAGGLVLTAYLLVALLPGGGLGLGDVKLAGVLALMLGFAGWPAVLVGLVAPHLINGPIAVLLLAKGRVGRRRPLAFGPALLAGALLALTVI